MILTYKRKIFGYECDIYGHLNNANYMHLYEEARSEALAELGFPLAFFHENNINIFVTHIEIDFKKGVKFEEEITIQTELSKFSRIKSRWTQKIYDKNGNLCNNIIVDGAFVRNGKPFRLPKELLEKMNAKF